MGVFAKKRKIVVDVRSARRQDDVMYKRVSMKVYFDEDLYIWGKEEAVRRRCSFSHLLRSLFVEKIEEQKQKQKQKEIPQEKTENGTFV